MKKLIFLFLFLPAVAAAQWSVTPEVGVLFSNAISEKELYLDLADDDAFLKTDRAYKSKIGYTVGCKAAYRLVFGLKFSSGVIYTNESYEYYGNRIKYGSLSIPALLGYDYYFNKILLSANVGAAYNYGLSLFFDDSDNYFPALKGRTAVNIIADVGVGYKISEGCVLKLIIDYSQRTSYFKMNILGSEYVDHGTGKPYHIGIKAGIEMLL